MTLSYCCHARFISDKMLVTVTSMFTLLKCENVAISLHIGNGKILDFWRNVHFPTNKKDYIFGGIILCSLFKIISQKLNICLLYAVWYVTCSKSWNLLVFAVLSLCVTFGFITVYVTQCCQYFSLTVVLADLLYFFHCQLNIFSAWFPSELLSTCKR